MYLVTHVNYCNSSFEHDGWLFSIFTDEFEFLQEYEKNQSPEAKFVKDLDRLDLVMQAFEYEKRDNCPGTHQEFFDSTEGKFNHPMVVNLVEEIKSQRREMIKKRELEEEAQKAQPQENQN